MIHSFLDENSNIDKAPGQSAPKVRPKSLMLRLPAKEHKGGDVKWSKESVTQ